MAEVTVIIPTHNRRALLARTLHSVLAQRDVDLEVVVVDDGSSDGTATAVAGLADDRVSVVRHPQPRGVSAARNTGIEKASSPWLAFVDDDDLWAPGKLRSQLDAIAADGSSQWSCTGSVNIDRECRLMVLGPQHPHQGRDPASKARLEALALLEWRGSSPRNYKNAVVFLAADATRLKELKQAVRQHLAWSSIWDDRITLNLDRFQTR